MGFEENKTGWRSSVFAAAFVALALLVTLAAIPRLYIRTRRLGEPPACLAPPHSAADLEEDSEPSLGEHPSIGSDAYRRAAVRYYIRKLRDEDSETRRRAAEALANLGDLSALPHLIRSMPFGDLALEPAFSNLRRGASSPPVSSMTIRRWSRY